ncbi:PDR/VanB family oxidoreductase [Actinoplanes sp. CA-054009]
MDLVVRDARPVADGVVALELAREDGGELPGWTPGAHIDLDLGGGLTRQYSLCGRAGDTRSWRVAVLRAPDSRGGSERVHQLAAGSRVRALGPRNHFPVATSPRYLFLAGGIGITPLLPMIDQVSAAGAEWELHYGGRSLASMAFVGELARFGDRVHLVPSGPLDLPVILGTPRPGTLVYACGPEPMLDAVERHCSAWPPGSLRLERFTGVAASGGSAFEVVLHRSGRTIPVAADKSIFETVRAAGVSVLGSCLEGTCGTCETEVIDGEVDHRDSVLDEDERAANDVMMICVSRCKGSRLTLDL